MLTSITPFGQTGPYRSFKANDLIAEAVGGAVWREGEPGEAPFTRPHYQAFQLAGLHAAFGTLVALWERNASGRGQHVDVSLQEVVAHQDLNLVNYSSIQQILQRSGHRAAGRMLNCYPCRDGWVHLSPSFVAQRQALVAWMGDPELAEARYIDGEPLEEHEIELIDERISAFTRRFTVAEFLLEATRLRIAVAPFHSVAEFVHHQDTAARAFFVDTRHPVIGRYRAPGAPVRYSRTPWRIRRPAPLLGEHTTEVLQDLERKVISRTPRRGLHRSDGRLPLEGIRVIDLSRVWAGPYGTRFLADFGAEVIKVESGKFPDYRALSSEPDPAMWRRTNTSYAEINRNKLSVTVDLHTDPGRELVKRLVAVSDVVVDNYHPATLPRWGLDYSKLRDVKKDIIVVSCPGYGNYGPSRDLYAFGGCLSSFVGMASLWGFPGSPPNYRSKWALPDFVTPAYTALAVLAALHHRAATGEGQYIENVQVEAAASMIGTAYLEYFLNGREPEPFGNRDVNAAPQGVYHCTGGDRWCAISCATEEEWQTLARLMGRSELCEDPRFTTRAARQLNHDALDQYITQWTQRFTSHQVMLTCQHAGVPAGAVETGEDLYCDPHLRARGYIVEIDHPAPGRLEHPGITVRLSRTPGQISRPAPLTGQHNDYVFGHLLGLDVKKREGLRDAGVLV